MLFLYFYIQPLKRSLYDGEGKGERKRKNDADPLSFPEKESNAMAALLRLLSRLRI